LIEGIVVGVTVLIIGIVVCIIVVKRRSAARELQRNGTTINKKYIVHFFSISAPHL
jgi:hypothetical protein